MNVLLFARPIILKPRVPLPRLYPFCQHPRCYAEGPSRRPRNKEIPYDRVRLVDAETSALGPFIPLEDILATLNKKEEMLELVAEKPDPIVKVVDKKASYSRMKEQKARKKDEAKTREEKEVQMTWGVASGDLQHKLKKARQELQKGNRVNLVFAPKKGQESLTPAQMAERVQETVDLLADVGKEWKVREAQGRTAVIHLQGAAPPPSD